MSSLVSLRKCNRAYSSRPLTTDLFIVCIRVGVHQAKAVAHGDNTTFRGIIGKALVWIKVKNWNFSGL